jgi:glutaredoxin 2
MGESYTTSKLSLPRPIKKIREWIDDNANSPESRWNSITEFAKTKAEKYTGEKKSAEINFQVNLGNDTPQIVHKLLTAISTDKMDDFKEKHADFLNSKTQATQVDEKKKSPRKN